MMKPYYQDDHATIYHADARELLPQLAFDVVVTDPPYGIALNTNYARASSSTKVYKPIIGDNQIFEPDFLLNTNKPCVLFGVDHFMTKKLRKGTCHVWDKRVNSASNFMSDFELIYTTYKSDPSRILRYQYVCGVHPNTKKQETYHPTQKPIPVMRWIMEQKKFPEGVIIDPFMGSGSTLRAAKDLNRQSIGIEIDEQYCEIAARRLAQEVLPL